MQPEHETDGEMADEGEAQEPPAPRNRAEFYKLFNQKGPTNMICGFMRDRSVKLMAHILVDISFPLENSYYTTMEKVSQGWIEQEKFVSGRSVGEWLVGIRPTSQPLGNVSVHETCHPATTR